MSILQGVCSYYRLFGPRGVFLVAKCRLTRKPMEIHVQTDGIAHPLQLRMRTTDISLFEEIVVNEEYLVDPSLSPHVIVDAGANIGLTAVYFANRFRQAKIFAIEPEESNFRMLRKNAALYPNIMPIQAALWKDSSPLQLTNPGDGNWGFQTHERAGPSRPDSCSVRGMTVDELMSEFSISFIDLLKVDIEGAEKEVFEVSARWSDRVGAIAVELHDRYKEGCSQSVLAAVGSFPVRWQKGETTFFFRNGTIPKIPRRGPIPTGFDGALHIKPRALRSRIVLAQTLGT